MSRNASLGSLTGSRLYHFGPLIWVLKRPTAHVMYILVYGHTTLNTPDLVSSEKATIYIFLVVLGFQVRAPHLLGKCYQWSPIPSPRPQLIEGKRVARSNFQPCGGWPQWVIVPSREVFVLKVLDREDDNLRGKAGDQGYLEATTHPRSPEAGVCL
jgi:hypothetical protein